MGAFEDFVNLELPKRISTGEDGNGSGSLPQGMALRTTGVGLGVETTPFPDSSIILLPTDSDIGGNRVVAVSDSLAVYADCLTVNAIAIGFSTMAVVGGNPVPVAQGGLIEIPGETLVSGLPVYLRENGLVSQTPPSVGFIQQVGIATSESELLIGVKQRIILN